MADYSNIGNNMLLKMYHMIDNELDDLHTKYVNDQYKLYYVYLTDFINMDDKDLVFKHWAREFIKYDDLFSDDDKIFYIPVKENDTMLKLHSLVVEYHALYGYKIYDVVGHGIKKEVYSCVNQDHLLKYLRKVQLYLNEIKPNTLGDGWQTEMHFLLGEESDGEK